jgi:hypothetical protein
VLVKTVEYQNVMQGQCCKMLNFAYLSVALSSTS